MTFEKIKPFVVGTWCYGHGWLSTFTEGKISDFTGLVAFTSSVYLVGILVSRFVAANRVEEEELPYTEDHHLYP